MQRNRGGGMTDEEVRLDRAEYTVAEVAYILNVSPRTVRTYFERDSEARPGERLLTAEKRGTIWFIKKHHFERYLQEVFGAARTS